jgi:hypothetical protein
MLILVAVRMSCHSVDATIDRQQSESTTVAKVELRPERRPRPASATESSTTSKTACATKQRHKQDRK